MLDAATTEALEGLGGGPAVELEDLRSLPPALARLVLRSLAEEASGGRRALSRGDAEAVLALGAGRGGTTSLDLGDGLRAVAEYGTLRFSLGAEAPPPAAVELAVPGTARFGAWEVEADIGPGEVSVSAEALGGALTVRGWRDGDRMRPVGLGGTKTLQDLFTDRKVPRALRRSLPVVEARRARSSGSPEWRWTSASPPRRTRPGPLASPLAVWEDEPMEPASPPAVSPANEEAIEAWNGVLFDRFVEYRDILVRGLGAHGEAAFRKLPPAEGDRAVDLGCGFGDTAQRLAELVGPQGSVLGIDAAERFIDLAREEAERAGAGNLRFEVADVEVGDIGGPFEYAFSRFGTMFFANPVAALRNIRGALVPGGRLTMVVWRRKLDNGWLHRAEQVVDQFLEHNEDSDEPTCGPGPFSMADADVTTAVMMNAGFEDVSLLRSDLDFKVGESLDKAVDLVMALGPAGEVIRLAGDQADAIRPKIEAELKEALSEYETEDGVWSASSTWIASGRA